MKGEGTYYAGFSPFIADRPTETPAEKLERLSKALTYNESKTSRANGICAASLRRQIRRLMQEMEAGR